MGTRPKFELSNDLDPFIDYMMYSKHREIWINILVQQTLIIVILEIKLPQFFNYCETLHFVPCWENLVIYLCTIQ